MRSSGCVLLIAGPGYGKTTVLEACVAGQPPEYVRAADLHAALPIAFGGPRIAVDDLCALGARAQTQVARALAALRAPVRITVAASRPLGAAALAALPAPVAVRGPADLALSPEAFVHVLSEEHGVADLELAALAHGVTAGWPALAHLAGAVLARPGVTHRDLLAALSDPGTPGAHWVAERVLAALPSRAAAVLRQFAALDPIAPALVPGSEQALDWLARTGLVVPHPQHRGLSQVVPVVAAVARQGRSGSVPSGVARWYAANGHPLAAARALAAAGATARCAALIEDEGDRMIAAGGAAEVVRLVRRVPAPSARLRLVLGDALRTAGEVTEARQILAGLAGGEPAPALAWRAGMVEYMRADYRAALSAWDVPPGDGLDGVFLRASSATALVLLGRPDEAAPTAQAALGAALALGEDRGIAAAHLAAAAVTVGVRRDGHLAEALAAAERAGDVIQQARVLLYQADRLLTEARYPQALDVAARAVRTAALGGPPGVLVTALHNEGEALTRLGRYSEAAHSFGRSLRISRRVGLNRTAAGLYGLAEVHSRLGRRQEARGEYEEAAELARASAELQILVPALAGLARLLATSDPGAAGLAAGEAGHLAPPDLMARARIAGGWVALAGGDLALAQLHAVEAVTAARSARQSDTLAEALELSAAVSTDRATADAGLREAAAIWTAAGAHPAADQIAMLIGRSPGASSEQRLAGRAATIRLAALGVPVTSTDNAATVQVFVLGRFEVLAGGRAVPLPAWRSRQARTLLKILVARRGRPVPRETLCELLWPDDDPRRTAHRLSVLLSAVRAVLDPVRLWPADHYVRADAAGLALESRRFAIDAEDLLRDAAHGIELARAGDDVRALEILSEADGLYRGDAFDDEPYEEWADALREQARAAWLQALRELAGVHRRAGDPGHAAAVLIRLLGADLFDEDAHRALVEVLVQARRHGEARRAFARWTRAMRSIDAPPPGPAVLLAAAHGLPRPAGQGAFQQPVK